MQFKGHLLLPGDDGPGLSVNLDVAEHHLAVESDGGGLGAWPLEAVDVERLEGDIFALTVAGEPLRFVAEDTIAFAYTGVPTIERTSPRHRPRSGLRSFVDRIWNTPEKPGGSPDDPPATHAVVEPGERESDLPDDSDSFPGFETVVEHVEAPIEPDMADPDLRQQDPGSLIPTIGGEPTNPPPVDEVSETRCPALRSDGRRCESPILTSSGYCYPHDPRRAFDDKYQAAQDARNQIRREATGRLNRIYSRLDKAMRQVERGELDPETAMAMAQLARTMCAILDVDATSTSKGGRE